ncbi:hypothetical protein [Halapricum salinum]|nr:hypothetical protein [Halapricum salinum]
MPFETWVESLQDDLRAAATESRSERPPSRSLTWVAADSETEDDADDHGIDAEPRGADDETVAAAVAAREGGGRAAHAADRRSGQRSTAADGADDEAVAQAIARVDRR